MKLVPIVKLIGKAIVWFTIRLTLIFSELFCIPNIKKQNKDILNEAKKANILSGIHCASPEYAAKAVKWGFDLVTVNSDVKLLSEMANHVVKKTRNLF